MSLERIEQKIDKLIDVTHKIQVEAAQNTVDLRHHIKRTDILEKQQTQMIKLLFIGAGIGIALYGPQVFDMLKVLL